MAQDDTPLLDVQDLHVRLQTAHGLVSAVRGLSLRMQRGDTVGLIGESGCGKSITAMALMGLLPEGAQVQGSIRLQGTELTRLDEASLCQVRGNRIAMVFQEPMTALNPLHTIGRQVAEPLIIHKGASRAEARAEALRLLERVGIADARHRLDAYPHQFSGGQRQRITIAMALACGPDLLIADEPTTALDVTIAGQILRLIRELVDERGMGLVLISHDLGVIASQVGHMLVMYGGTVVESGPTREVFTRRSHPYTQGLFASRPQFGLRPLASAGTTPTAPKAHTATAAPGRRERLPAIPGTVPELHRLPPGCPFAERCAVVQPGCAETPPPVVDIAALHQARCVRLQAPQDAAPGQPAEVIL